MRMVGLALCKKSKLRRNTCGWRRRSAWVRGSECGIEGVELPGKRQVYGAIPALNGANVLNLSANDTAKFRDRFPRRTVLGAVFLKRRKCSTLAIATPDVENSAYRPYVVSRHVDK